MAKDDMLLIAYKILRYFYECNKAGKAPTFSDMFRVLELPGVSMNYLGRIVTELSQSGYIDGVRVTPTKSGNCIELKEEAGITLKGVDYLNENSVMKKAASFAGKGFEILIEAIISATL